MFNIDDKDIRRLESDLQVFADRAFPFATKQTVNSGAFQAMKIARADLPKRMTLRNTFTARSIQVEQARTLNVRHQAAVVGSVADYLETQEFGGTESGPIATNYSAGQGRGARPRTRLPRKPNKLSSINLRGRSGRGGRSARNAAAVRQAAAGGNKYVFLDLGRTRGIFRVTGGKRSPKVEMVWSMSRPTVRVPANPWLRPAVVESERMLPAFYADALRQQLRRRGLFRG